VTADQKPVARRREPALVPVGYTIAPTRQRMTRPLHSRRDEVRANAEAVFTMSNSADELVDTSTAVRVAPAKQREARNVRK
jgi:hypothetical protein